MSLGKVCLSQKLTSPEGRSITIRSLQLNLRLQPDLPPDGGVGGWGGKRRGVWRSAVFGARKLD